MGASPATDKPTATARLLLALLLATTVLLGVAPLTLLLLLLLLAALASTAAVALAHCGGLDLLQFRLADLLGLATLVTVIILTFALRPLARSPASLPARVLAFCTRRPFLTVALALAFLTVVLVQACWDATSGVGSLLSSTVILDDLHFFAPGVALLVLVLGGSAVLSFYRWIVATRYRTGVWTGVLAVLAVPLVAAEVLAHAAGLQLPHHIDALHAAPSLTEMEYRLLQQLDVDVEGRPPPAPVATPSADRDDQAFQDCFLQLKDLEPIVADRVQRDFRFSPDDAHDVVREALLRVCIRHSTVPYPNLAGALTVAARNRAIDWKRRSRTECGLDSQLPACDLSSPDENVRSKTETAVLSQAICQLPARAREILYSRAVDGEEFEPIGARYGLTADQARWEFHNATRRVAKAYRDRCGE